MILAIAGDLHGALDALYDRLRTWEARSGRRIVLVLQSGDLGAFTNASILDRSTRKRMEKDPLELGAAPYLEGVKTAPWETWFVRGNHEDFRLLGESPDGFLDPARRIRLLQGGRIHTAPGGLRIAALGGIQPRQVREPGLPKYVQDAEAKALLGQEAGCTDILLTHDGPIGRSLQGVPSAGSIAVYNLLKRLRPRWHFFGHYDRPLPPFDLFGCRSVCMNQPGPARIPGRDGSVAILDAAEHRFAWIDADGSERVLLADGALPPAGPGGTP